MFVEGMWGMKNVDLMFDSIFNEEVGKNKFLFEQFGKIYNLARVTNSCEVSKELFNYCIKKIILFYCYYMMKREEFFLIGICQILYLGDFLAVV